MRSIYSMMSSAWSTDASVIDVFPAQFNHARPNSKTSFGMSELQKRITQVATAQLGGSSARWCYGVALAADKGSFAAGHIPNLPSKAGAVPGDTPRPGRLVLLPSLADWAGFQRGASLRETQTQGRTAP
jgi:hypothetical protein